MTLETALEKTLETMLKNFVIINISGDDKMYKNCKLKINFNEDSPEKKNLVFLSKIINKLFIKYIRINTSYIYNYIFYYLRRKK